MISHAALKQGINNLSRHRYGMMGNGYIVKCKTCDKEIELYDYSHDNHTLEAWCGICGMRVIEWHRMNTIAMALDVHMKIVEEIEEEEDV